MLRAVTDTELKYVKRRGSQDFAAGAEFDSGTETVHTMTPGEQFMSGKEMWEYKVISGGRYALLTAPERQLVIDAGVRDRYFRETGHRVIQTASISAGVCTIDFTAGLDWKVNVTENVTTFTVIKPINVFIPCRVKVKQKGTFTFDFSSIPTANWAGGVKPDVGTMGVDNWVWLWAIYDGEDETWGLTGELGL